MHGAAQDADYEEHQPDTQLNQRVLAQGRGGAVTVFPMGFGVPTGHLGYPTGAYRCGPNGVDFGGKPGDYPCYHPASPSVIHPAGTIMRGCVNDGYSSGWKWPDGYMGGSASMDQKIDDVSFISHLIDVMGASSFNVDLNRVYVMGFSQGGARRAADCSALPARR